MKLNKLTDIVSCKYRIRAGNRPIMGSAYGAVPKKAVQKAYI